MWNGRFRSKRLHPLFRFGDPERCALRPGNIHSARWPGICPEGLCRRDTRPRCGLRSSDGDFALTPPLPFRRSSICWRPRAGMTRSASRAIPSCTIRIGWLIKRRPDNRSGHKSPGDAQTVQDIAARFSFLPPYSPDLNPIEMAFSKLKTVIRKAAARTYDQLWQAVGHVCDLFLEEKCCNFFIANGGQRRPHGNPFAISGAPNRTPSRRDTQCISSVDLRSGPYPHPYESLSITPIASISTGKLGSASPCTTTPVEQ